MIKPFRSQGMGAILYDAQAIRIGYCEDSVKVTHMAVGMNICPFRYLNLVLAGTKKHVTMGKLHSGWEAPKIETFLAFNVSAVTKGHQLIAIGEVGNPMLAIGVDIGRTKIAIAVVDGRGGIVAREQITAPSAEDPASVSDAVGKLISKTLIRYPDIVAAGVGTPELVEWPDGVVRAGLWS